MVQTTIVGVVSVKNLSGNILRIEIDRPVGFNFKAGQFARIGINTGNDGPDKIWRAQTIVSRAEEHKILAFYIIYIAGKPFSDALKKIKAGDEVYLDAQPYGHFTLDRFGPGGDLWLFSTGTGVAPYLCMLQQEKIWENFSTVTLICSFKDQIYDLDSILRYIMNINPLQIKEKFNPLQDFAFVSKHYILECGSR